jgi:hypothetical protein
LPAPRPLDGSAPGVGLGALRTRGLIGDHSDAIRLCNPDAPPAHLTPDLCRRSPPAGDRWHIRQPVPAARFTAVLPRGSSGDIEEPAGTGRGTGTQRKDRCSGGPETSGGGRREPGGVRSGRWRCRSGTRSPTACDPSASLLRPAPSRPERAWPFGVAGTLIGRPSRASARRAPCIGQGQARCARPFGTLDGGVVVRSGVVEGQGELLASRAVRGRYVVESSGVVKPLRMSQV